METGFLEYGPRHPKESDDVQWLSANIQIAEKTVIPIPALNEEGYEYFIIYSTTKMFIVSFHIMEILIF